MKNLGKLLLLLALLPNAIYASVSASVDYASVTVGDTVTYSIKVDEKNIQRPMIKSICGSGIIATSVQTNIEMINGNYTRTKVLSYKFMPQKSCVIKPLNIIVNGKTYTTNAIKVEVKPATQDLNADFVVELQSTKKDLYVGEPFTMTMLIKQKHTAQALDSKFIAPEMKGFWKGADPKQEKYDDGAFTITKLTYRLSAQREGNLSISPAQLAIASRSNQRDRWGSFMQNLNWKSYFSNELTFHAKAIPNGAQYIGDFSIKVTADKNEVNPNEAVNITIQINGNGNLEDIQKFKPYIKDVSVFEEKPSIIGNNFTQKLALVGDNNFVVPAFNLKFFNPKTQTQESISTQAIHIKVNGAKPSPKLNIKRAEKVLNIQREKTTPVVQNEQVSMLWLALVFIFGIILGAVLMVSKPWEKIKREKSFDIKDEKKLLIKLLPFKDDDKEVKKIVDILEHNIYSDDKQKIDKKVFKEILKRYALI